MMLIDGEDQIEVCMKMQNNYIPELDMEGKKFE